MIDWLRLKHFQSWEDLELPLGMVTVIVGETDQGKSALIRALSAVCYNALEGSSFVRSGGAWASIGIHTDEGDNIWLEKGNSTNTYYLNGKIYDKVGRSVPEDVQKILKISEVEIDGDSLRLQFQSQLDSPFLITDQGVRATRFLGSISKVAIIYQAARVSTKKRKDSLISLATLQSLESEIKEKVAGYDYLDELEPLIEELVSWDTRLENIEQEKAAVFSISETIVNQSVLVEKLVEKEKILQYSLELKSRFLEAQTRFKQTRSCFDQVAELTTEQGRLASLIEKDQSLAELFTRLVRFHERWSVLESEATILVNYSSLIEADSQMALALAINEDKKARLSKELAELEAKYTCPTCGSVNDAS